MSETWFEPWHVITIVAKRRSGKSTLATVFASHFTNQRIVFADVKRRYRMPAADLVAHGVDALQAAPVSAWRIHYVPAAIASVDNKKAVDREWSAFFDWCNAQTDLTVLLDECVPMPAPATGAPGSLVHYVGQKAADRCGIIACTGRWRGLLVDLKAHANVIIIFPGGLAVDELEDAAREMGLGHVDEQSKRKVKPLDELRALLKQAEELGPYACVMWLRDEDRFVIFELPAELVHRAIAIEVAP